MESHLSLVVKNIVEGMWEPFCLKRFAMEMAAVEYQHTNKTKWRVADSSLCKMIAGQA